MSLMKSPGLPMAVIFGVVLGIVGTIGLSAQQVGHLVGGSGHVLLRTDLTGEAGKEVYMTLFEPSSGARFGPHTHPGDEFSYILDGTVRLDVAGAESKVLHPGDTFHVERDKVHGGQVISDTPAKILSVHVVDKGKPLIIPVK
jgi:quercetin dioxygenase-like cupin family protein